MELSQEQINLLFRGEKKALIQPSRLDLSDEQVVVSGDTEVVTLELGPGRKIGMDGFALYQSEHRESVDSFTGTRTFWLYPILSFTEKGQGRGWWGPPKGTHVGRTKRTEAGGAKLTFTGPRLSDAAKAGVIEQYESIPGWARSVVNEIEMVNRPGDVFEAGGQQFRAGAEWHQSTGKIRIYDVERHGASKDLLAHEVGHGLQHRWVDEGHEQEIDAISKHPEWFDRSGYAKLEFAEQHTKEYPLAASRDLFGKAWAAGEDGITSYSKAWAKSGNFSETIAEMTKLYLSLSPTAFSTYMGREGAPNLGRAFVDVVDYFEGQAS